MKILLINPYWEKVEGNIWKIVSGSVLPAGIAIIASCLEKAGFEVKVLDISALKLSQNQIKQILQNETYDFYGITSTTFIYKEAIEIAKLCKALHPESKIIFGGVHASIFPEEVLKNDFIDYVIRGEGEESIVELINNGPVNIAGISYKTNGSIIHNPDRPLIENLDNIPFPAYHLFPLKHYYPAMGGYRQLPAISMITSRGCPGRCTFCYKEMFGTKTRLRSPESLIEEIKLLYTRYHIREITFYDDTFTVSRERVNRLCELLLINKIKISWSCMSRIDFMDRELLGIMKKAGCHQICYGIESGDINILKNIKKPLNLTKAEEICINTKKVGITLRNSFMLGNPGETEESINKTIQFAKKLNADIVQFNITTPYPGSEMFTWAKNNNYLNTYEWKKYDLSHMVMNLPSIQSSLVEKYYKLAYKKFYFRPRFIAGKIFKTLRPSEIITNIKVFLKLLYMTMGKKNENI